MNIILLCGGSGKRLWPLSNSVRSKQFLKIFRKNDDTKESMVQRMLRMIKAIDGDAVVTIATSKNQIPQIESQLGKSVWISVEPSRKDTFPAIALAVSYLKQQGVPEQESVVICPVDPYVDEGYFRCLQQLANEAAKPDAANITLMGITPNSPSSKFGYIIPATDQPVSKVKTFKEKPDRELAIEYIQQGALWNGGVFAFKISYLLEISRRLLGTDDYYTLYSSYQDLKAISFDYAVVEKEESINVIRYDGLWNDLGTWNTLTTVMDDFVSGNASAYECDNTYVINELSIPLIALGMKDAIIAATPDGVLACHRDLSDRLKDYVKDQKPMYERRQWGEYKVLHFSTSEDGLKNLTRELSFEAGKQVVFNSHEERIEIWTVVNGSGIVFINNQSRRVAPGDTVVIEKKATHGINAITNLSLIEVQIGNDLGEDDTEIVLS